MTMDRKFTGVVRVPKEFHDDILDIQRKRVDTKASSIFDEEIRSTTRLLKGLVRTPSWPKVRDEAIKLPFVKQERERRNKMMSDKRGNLPGLFASMGLLLIVIVVSLIGVLIFGSVDFGLTLFTNAFTSTPTSDDSPTAKNITVAAETTFGNYGLAVQQFHWISFLFIIGMIIGIFISSALIKIHPGFFFLYIIISAMIVYLSIPISNAYDAIQSGSGDLALQLQSYVGTSWIMQHLPEVMAVVSFLGAIFLFVRLGDENEVSAI